MEGSSSTVLDGTHKHITEDFSIHEGPKPWGIGLGRADLGYLEHKAHANVLPLRNSRFMTELA